MQQHKVHSAAGSRTPPRPGALRLVIHIVKGAFVNGMQFPALLCIGLTMALYHEQFPYHEIIAALLVGSLVLIGLLRGCINWQEDLAEYQGHLAMLRHQEQLGESKRDQAGRRFIPYMHR
ncbi:MAG: hypothetical protein HKP57_06310 [Halobacteria archaeon]|nr:hypothetical protein [Halobacteria archaeon]